jgi:hypothetical protein
VGRAIKASQADQYGLVLVNDDYPRVRHECEERAGNGVPNWVVEWNLITSQPVPFSVRVGGGEGQLTI